MDSRELRSLLVSRRRGNPSDEGAAWPLGRARRATPVVDSHFIVEDECWEGNRKDTEVRVLNFLESRLARRETRRGMLLVLIPSSVVPPDLNDQVAIPPNHDPGSITLGRAPHRPTRGVDGGHGEETKQV